MNVPWSEVELFLAIAEAGSLSAAARRLRVTQPTVSRRLAELEASLGEPLFARRVEGATLTPFGERLVEPARRMAEWSAEVDRAADRAETSPRGVVRVTAPPGVAFDFLAPFAAELAVALPEVRLEVVSTIQYLDLARREADLALRMARPPQRDHVVLASLEHDVLAYATPEYAARLPKGFGLADVGWIGWAPPLDHLSPNADLAAKIPGFRPVFASDDYLVQLRAAFAGVGAIFLGRVENRFALPSPLVPLPLDVGPLRGGMHLVASRSALEIPRVRAVAERLAREIDAVAAVERRRRQKRDAAPKRARR
jgi:DNA-binding transcriptional LysR family regulator